MRAILLLLLALDPAFVKATVESLGATISKEYFDPAVGRDVDAALRRSLADGRYAGAGDDQALASLITRDLYAATRDKHLVMQALRDVPAERERSAGNVGYLEMTTFFRPEEAGDAIATAMRMLAHADALILDMRPNGGGSPDTVARLASYLLEPGVPLWEIAHRPPDGPDHYATVIVPTPDVTRPVYVLTSPATFSGGEGLAFILQERHRAEIVGEVTAGAANAGRPYRVNARFSVTIPNGQVKSAVGGGNWEGAGVTPDVKTSAADALTVAHGRALRRLIDRERPGPWRDALERALKTVDAR